MRAPGRSAPGRVQDETPGPRAASSSSGRAVSVIALQRAAGNRAVAQLLARDAAKTTSSKAKDKRGRRDLPPFVVKRDWGGGWTAWKFEFESWVFAHDVIRTLFVKRELPAGCSLETTRPNDGAPNLYWTLTWTRPIDAALLTAEGATVRQRASRGNEETDVERWRREETEARAREANRQHNQTYVPALGMTGEQALSKLKPGVYVAAPGMVMRPIPPPNADDSVSDVSWMRQYVKGGVFVYVSGTTQVTGIHVREIGRHELFHRWMVWYMQRGRTLAQAEREYIELLDDLNRMMIGAFAMALTSAPRVGPRQNLIRPNLRGGGKPGSVVRNVDPLGAVGAGLQTYGVVEMLKDLVAMSGDPERAAALEAHGRGDLYQLPVSVAGPELDDDEEAADAAPKLQREVRNKRGSGPKRGAAAKRGAARLRVPERVDRFVRELSTVYQREIANARTANPNVTHSMVGIIAEKKTLAVLPTLAKKQKLNPGHIWVGDFPSGVTGPKGGMITAEAGSVYYNFMIELKKSPRAVRSHQAQAQLIGIEHTINFSKGRGRYYRLYGENFKPGQGTFRYEAPAKPRPKPRRR